MPLQDITSVLPCTLDSITEVFPREPTRVFLECYSNYHPDDCGFPVVSAVLLLFNYCASLYNTPLSNAFKAPAVKQCSGYMQIISAGYYYSVN